MGKRVPSSLLIVTRAAGPGGTASQFIGACGLSGTKFFSLLRGGGRGTLEYVNKLRRLSNEQMKAGGLNRIGRSSKIEVKSLGEIRISLPINNEV